MALVKSGLFDKIEGSLEDVTFRTRRNKKTELGAKRIPYDPKSLAQLDNRAGYSRLVEVYNEKTWIDMTQYERLAALTDISEWNAFVQRHQATMSRTPGWYYGFAESSGGLLHDFEKDGIDLDIIGASWDTYGKAQLSALHFDEINDRVDSQTPAPMQLDFTESLEILMWVKVTSQTINQRLISQYEHIGTGYKGYEIVVDYYGRVVFYVYGDSFEYEADTLKVIGSTIIWDGEWHKVRAIRDKEADEGRLYIDDELEGQATDPTVTDSLNDMRLSIGSLPGGGHYLGGDIREVSIKIWEP